jgi:hypothetical protein
METNEKACRANPGEVIIQRDNLDKSLEELSLVISTLETRLVSVLKPTDMSHGILATPPKVDILAPLAEELRVFHSRINDMADNVRSITSRLEL